MNEYLMIGAGVLTTYLLFAFLRKKYFEKYKYYELFINVASILLFAILFLPVYDRPVKNTGFSIVLLVLLMFYFIYNICNEIVRLKKGKTLKR